MDDAAHPPGPQGRLAEVEAQIARILERLQALEARAAGNAATFRSGGSDAAAPSWLAPEGAAGQSGALGYSGRAQFGQARFSVDRRVPLAAAFGPDPESLARVFAALASRHRIVMLRALCRGPLSGQQLQDLAGINSPGQLHHHLKELMSASLVVQQGRSRYSIRPAAVIAVCVALALASDVLSGYENGGRPAPTEEPGSAPPERLGQS